MENISTEIIDKDGECLLGYDHYFGIKEAKQDIKYRLGDIASLNRIAENETTFADADCVRIMVDGECVFDRFF